jgi:hypothetical protein
MRYKTWVKTKFIISNFSSNSYFFSKNGDYWHPEIQFIISNIELNDEISHLRPKFSSASKVDTFMRYKTWVKTKLQ